MCFSDQVQILLIKIGFLLFPLFPPPLPLLFPSALPFFGLFFILDNETLANLPQVQRSAQ